MFLHYAFSKTEHSFSKIQTASHHVIMFILYFTVKKCSTELKPSGPFIVFITMLSILCQAHFQLHIIKSLTNEQFIFTSCVKLQIQGFIAGL